MNKIQPVDELRWTVARAIASAGLLGVEFRYDNEMFEIDEVRPLNRGIEVTAGSGIDSDFPRTISFTLRIENLEDIG